MSIRILEATKLANKLHSGQVRKVSGEPYIGHPIAVSYLVMKYKGASKNSEDLVIAAILHDVVEDTGYPIWKIAKDFGGLVAGLVQELTNCVARIKLEGKEEYQRKKMLGMSNYALVVKLCDRLHNISESPSQSMVESTIRLCNALEGGRTLSKTHKMIISDIRKELE